MTDENFFAKKLDRLGWGLFLTWLGIYLAWGRGRDGLFALGLGIIILGENLLRRHYGVKVSKFWVAVGFLFLLVGVLNFFNITLLPAVFILCGLVVLYRTFIKPSP